MQVARAVQIVARCARRERTVRRAEGPSVIAHERIDHRHRDRVVELLQPAHDERAMGPRAGERYVQVIAPAFGLEAALAARPGTAVGRHPTPENGMRTDEIGPRRAKVIALPLAVDHRSHRELLSPIANSLRAPQESSDDMQVGQNLTNSGLKSLQALLYRLITAPEGVAAGLAAERARGPALLNDSHDSHHSKIWKISSKATIVSRRPSVSRFTPTPTSTASSTA